MGFSFGIVLKIDLPISIRISTPQSADTGVDVLQFFCQNSIKISFIVAQYWFMKRFKIKKKMSLVSAR
jgi:hypothetical protein